MQKKKCSKCGVEKPLSEFWANKKGADVKRPDCRGCYGLPAVKQSIESKLWGQTRRVDKESCWIWTGYTLGKGGYGAIKHNNQRLLVHRVSYELHIGIIPAGLFVLHKCDNPPCVNPNHLFLGTNQDNMIDMVEKGRNKPRRGETNNKVKLTEAKVREIRQLYATGETSQRKLARRYGVGQPCIKDIVNKVTWSWLNE